MTTDAIPPVSAARRNGKLAVEPLTAAAFAAYGCVIELASGANRMDINAGTCVRYHDLARPVAMGPGEIGISLFDAAEASRPCALRLLERHILGTQAFVPFAGLMRMLVVVAHPGLDRNQLRPDHLRAFVSNGRQGIQINAKVWHHPLLSLQVGPWLIIDRIAETEDCEVLEIDGWNMACEL